MNSSNATGPAWNLRVLWFTRAVFGTSILPEHLIIVHSPTLVGDLLPLVLDQSCQLGIKFLDRLQTLLVVPDVGHLS